MKKKYNDLMSEKYKKTCKYLNYVEYLLILASTVSGCSGNVCGIFYTKVVDISRKTYEINGAETVNNDGILWLNKKHIEEGLGHKKLWEVTKKCNSNHRKHRCELVEDPKAKFNRIFMSKKLAVKMIMECSTTSAHKFGTRLWFKQ